MKEKGKGNASSPETPGIPQASQPHFNDPFEISDLAAPSKVNGDDAANGLHNTTLDAAGEVQFGHAFEWSHEVSTLEIIRTHTRLSFSHRSCFGLCSHVLRQLILQSGHD
jgi:hypothetical protein